MHRTSNTLRQETLELDWVVSHVLAPTPADSRPLSQPIWASRPTHGRTVAWSKLLSSIASPTHNWSNNRVLEIASKYPRLTRCLRDRSVHRLITILDPRGDGRRWAGEYPQFEFYSGGLDALGIQPTGTFDWIVRTARTGLTQESLEDLLSRASKLLGKAGRLVLPLCPSDEEDWVCFESAHLRARLRLCDRHDLGNGASVLVSRRR